MPADLAIIIPTRGRPENILKVISAWDFTNAWDVAEMVLAVDADDPEYQGYVDLFEQTRHPNTGEALISVSIQDRWVPMVHKLDSTARLLTRSGRYFALGFAGDDHLPRTINWATTYLTNLHDLGTGMVYGDDGYQGEKLSTEWAMTADIVSAWGRMVPAPVEHMYCDQALLEALTDAGAARHLPQVQIEHMHPIVKKAAPDEQYRRVNSSTQFARDKGTYDAWTNGERAEQVAIVKKLRADRPEERPRSVGRRITRRREVTKRMPSRSPFPRFFRQVKSVTPEEIGLTLADLASQVPADRAIVELGVYHGASVLRLAWGARQGLGAHVWGIDPWDLPGNVYGETMGGLDSARRWARHWVTSLGYSDRVTLTQNFSHAMAEIWGDGMPEVGLLFIDGDHTAEGARRDIEGWAPHLAEGAVIAIDDYVNENYPGVREAVDALVTAGTLAPVEVYHDRMAVTRLSGKVEGGASENQATRVTAITSEGAAIEHPGTALTVPSPYVAPIEELRTTSSTAGTVELDEFDVAVSLAVAPGEYEPDRKVVTADEAMVIQASPGTPIAELTLPQLRALAKDRKIVLGARKDKKADTLQAILDGR